MSVLINEFEIVPQPSGEGGGEASEAPAAKGREEGGNVTAHEVVTLVYKLEKRRARVWAH